MATQLVSTPKDIGLSHYASWREGQEELWDSCMEFMESDKRVLMIDAPTGVGKSLVAAATALSMIEDDPAAKAVITTSNIALQQQYIDEVFKGHVARAAWGRNKHECIIMPGLTVDQAPCQAGYKCAKKHECGYFVERDQALEASVSVLNSMFWLTLANFAETEGAAGRNLAIHDEAHFLEGSVRSLVSANLNKNFFSKQGIPFPRANSNMDWIEWIAEHRQNIHTQALAAQRDIRAGGAPAQYRPLLRADEAISKISKWILPSQPLITRSKWGIKFEPIWGRDFAEDMLWRHADKHILMSATLNAEYTAETLGLDDDEYTSLNIKSPFLPMRRRIIFDPVRKVNAKTTDKEFKEVIDRMDDLLDQHKDQRGIVHSVSYARAEQILQHSRHSERMFTHRSGNMQSKQDAIDELIGSEDGILVSPAVGVGEDFGRGDNVRFQFFVKYPIPYLGDPVVRARVDDWKDSLWYEADQAFIQAVGRGTRSADDWCVNYVLDQGAGWRFSHLPEYVQDAIVFPVKG